MSNTTRVYVKDINGNEVDHAISNRPFNWTDSWINTDGDRMCDAPNTQPMIIDGMKCRKRFEVVGMGDITIADFPNEDRVMIKLWAPNEMLRETFWLV